jgi:hypothetical protein
MPITGQFKSAELLEKKIQAFFKNALEIRKRKAF